jgi:hypothetical protein
MSRLPYIILTLTILSLSADTQITRTEPAYLIPAKANEITIHGSDLGNLGEIIGLWTSFPAKTEILETPDHARRAPAVVMNGPLKVGQKQTASIRIKRLSISPDYRAHPITLRWHSLPAHVTATTPNIPGDKDEVVVEFSAAPQAPVGIHNQPHLEVKTKIKNKDIAAKSQGLKLDITKE